MKYTNETRNLSFDVDYENKKVLINGQDFWFDTENHIFDTNYYPTLEDFVDDNIDEIIIFLESQQTIRPEQETFRFEISFDDVEEFDLNLSPDDFFVKRYEIIIDVNYSTKRILYECVEYDQDLSDYDFNSKSVLKIKKKNFRTSNN